MSFDTETLDQYKNLKLTETELEEFRKDLITRDSTDLTILYEEFSKLEENNPFLGIITEELDSRKKEPLSNKEKFLVGLKESTLNELGRLLYAYEELNEEVQDETNSEVIVMLKEEISSRDPETIL
jgi:hypothetical protein